MVENAFGQSHQSIVVWPCLAHKDTPSYFKSFMAWVNQEKNQHVTFKKNTENDSVLAVIQFKSFELKKLKLFNRNKNQKKITGTVDGYVKISGSCTSPKIAGNITLENGFAQLSNFGRGALQVVEVDTSTFFDRISVIDSLHLSMSIKIGENYYIRNQQYLPLKAGLSGVLELTKKAEAALQLTGKLDVNDGYTKPLGKRFSLSNGSLNYTGTLDNPTIHLKSKYEPHRAKQDVKIWYIVEGTIEDPTFKFESEPFMEPKNMISYTLFGQPFYQLDSIEQNLVSSVVDRSTADQTTEVLLNRVEAIATEKLSVDVVRIDNTNAESGTVITTGWYLNPRVFFAIQNIIAGRPRLGFYLEYFLTENLKLILSQNDDHGQGVNLQYEYDY